MLAPPRDPPPPELPSSQPPDLATVVGMVTNAGYFPHGEHGKEKEKKKGRFKIFGSKR